VCPQIDCANLEQGLVTTKDSDDLCVISFLEESPFDLTFLFGETLPEPTPETL